MLYESLTHLIIAGDRRTERRNILQIRPEMSQNMKIMTFQISVKTSNNHNFLQSDSRDLGHSSNESFQYFRIFYEFGFIFERWENI